MSSRLKPTLMRKEHRRRPWVGRFGVFVGYSLLVLIVQVSFFSTMDMPHLRANVMVALCVEVVHRFPVFSAVAWSFVWGFVTDVFSGRLWGLHEATFMAAIALYLAASQHIDMDRLLYRVIVVCVVMMFQGLLLSFWVSPGEPTLQQMNVVFFRAVCSGVLAPLVMKPVEGILEAEEG